jgi:hypothetical protein
VQFIANYIIEVKLFITEILTDFGSFIDYYYPLQALTHAQIRRGAFNNSGSRDVGKDPYWDFKTGTRIKDKSYEELFLKDNPNEMDHGDQYSRAYYVKRTKE